MTSSFEFVLILAFGNEDNIFFFLAHTQVTPTIMIQARRMKHSALANPIIQGAVGSTGYNMNIVNTKSMIYG